MSTQTKLLTVSIAAYNCESFIAGTLSSLCTAEQEELEILVIDDGATDSTADIAEEFARTHNLSCRVIRKENEGYASTVMRGIQEAQGRYFRLLDGDDWYDHDGLQALLQTLKTTSSDLVITPWIREVPNNPHVRDIAPNIDSGQYNLSELPFDSALAMHGATFRTEILKTVSINLPLRCFYTDILFVTQALRHVETAYVTHIPVYHYRLGVDGQTVSDESRLAHVEDMITVLNRLVDVYVTYPDLQSTGARMTADLISREYDTFLKVLFKAPVSSNSWDNILQLRNLLQRSEQLKNKAEHYGSQSFLLSKATLKTYPFVARAYRTGKKAKDVIRKIRH